MYAPTKTYTQIFIRALFTRAKRWKQPTPASADEWINKCGISIHIQEYYSTIKSIGILVCAIMLPCWLIGNEYACQCKRQEFDPWVRKIPWRGKWQVIPVFLPGKFHGQRSLAGSMGSQRLRHDLVTMYSSMHMLSH